MDVKEPEVLDLMRKGQNPYLTVEDRVELLAYVDQLQRGAERYGFLRGAWDDARVCRSRDRHQAVAAGGASMTLNLRGHLKYAGYVWRHKAFVYRAGREMGLGRWQLLKHDWTKLLPSEWTPYVNNFNPAPNSTLDPSKVRADFAHAWLLHQNRNAHHWQFWVVMSDAPNWNRTPRYAICDYASRNSHIVDNMPPNGEPFDTYGLQIPYTDLDNRHSERENKIAIRLVRSANQCQALEMPHRYVYEMVADWIGAGKAISGKNDVKAWYEKHREVMVLHPKTRDLVEVLISVYG